MLETEDPRASLQIVGGPLKGQTFELTAQSVTLGREPTNGIAIRDASISRHHCRIEYRDGAFHLSDLQSRNGTLLNDAEITNSPLKPGDRIQIGNCVIRFEPDAGREDKFDATMVLKRGESIYLTGEQPPATERSVQDLDALLRFSRTLSALRTVDDIVSSAVETLAAVARAGRIAILLADEISGELVLAKAWASDGREFAAAQVSRTVQRRVLEEGAALLSNDIASDDHLAAAHSLRAARVRSVLAVPLLVFDKVIGLVYLETSEAGAEFDAPLMHLLTALGNIAALGIENARHVEWLEGENRRLRQELELRHNMIGDSPVMRDVYQFIGRVAPSSATVLVTGESGTGKELVARALHASSPRAARPFVAINCGAFVETLLESELFGHERGAFTGAVAQKRGKLEMAEGGTVFLDEIGELAPPLQVKLLRVLQQREFERVGGTRTLKLDIRLIAATNRDLRAEVRAGRFREDLYYRLNVVSIKMPALRERRDDILQLANYFAQQAAASSARKITGIAPAARACMLRYDWPGNVRELENAIERAVVMGSGEIILPEDLPESVLEQGGGQDSDALPAFHDAVIDAKRSIVVRAIDRANGNYTEAAKALGLHPNHFFRLIRTLNLKPKRQKPV